VGNITSRNKNGQVVYSVKSIVDINSIIIPHFYKYPPIGPLACARGKGCANLCSKPFCPFVLIWWNICLLPMRLRAKVPLLLAFLFVVDKNTKFGFLFLFDSNICLLPMRLRAKVPLLLALRVFILIWFEHLLCIKCTSKNKNKSASTFARSPKARDAQVKIRTKGHQPLLPLLAVLLFLFNQIRIKTRSSTFALLFLFLLVLLALSYLI